MTTLNEREIAFKEELEDLLRKHGVELTVEDHYSGYAECGSDTRMHAYAKAEYDEGKMVKETIDLDFGLYFP